MNDHHIQELRSPILKREDIKFATYADIGGGQHELVRFTRPIIWLRDESSQWQLLLDGDLIKEGSTFNGFYGPGISIKECIQDCEDVYKKHTSATVEITTTMKEFAAIQAAKEPFYQSAIAYHSLPGWLIADEAFEKWHAADRPGYGGDHGIRSARDLTAEAQLVVWRNGMMTEAGAELYVRLGQDRRAMGEKVVKP